MFPSTIAKALAEFKTWRLVLSHSEFGGERCDFQREASTELRVAIPISASIRAMSGRAAVNLILTTKVDFLFWALFLKIPCSRNQPAGVGRQRSRCSLMK